MSGTDSRLPGPMSWAERYTAAPPSWTMATSKVTRVRSDGFSKMSARVRPASGVTRWPALSLALSSAVSLKMSSTCFLSRSRTETK